MWERVGLILELGQGVVDAVKTEVLAAFQGFDIFRTDKIDPVGNPVTVLRDIRIDPSSKGIQNLINAGGDFRFVLVYCLPGSKQPLQVIAIPPVLVRNKPQIPLSERLESEDFGPAPLRIPILQHHGLEMILSLGIAVTEKSGFLRLSHNMRDSVSIAIDCYLMD